MLHRIISATQVNRGNIYSLCSKHNSIYSSISKHYEEISKRNTQPMLNDLFEARRNRAVRVASNEEKKREFERYQFLAGQQGLSVSGAEIKTFVDEYAQRRNAVGAIIDTLENKNADRNVLRQLQADEDASGDSSDSSSSSSSESSDSSYSSIDAKEDEESSESATSSRSSESESSLDDAGTGEPLNPNERHVLPLLPMPYLEPMMKRFSSSIEMTCRMNSPYSGLISSLQPPSNAQSVSANGFAIYNKIATLLPRVLFTQKGDTRTDSQLKLQQHLLTSAIPIIHYKDWELNKTKIMEHYGLTEDIKPYTHIGWPRRTGKTIGMSAFYGVLGLCLGRPATFGFISTGRPAVCEMFKYIHSFANQFADELGMHVKFTNSGPRPIILFTRPGQDESQGVEFIGLPKGVDNNRGYKSFDGIIVDEAAYVQPEVYSRVVLPVLRLMGTTGVFASSLNQNDDNYFTQLAKIKNRQGDLAFNVVGMEWACVSCKRKGLKSCPHMGYNVPSWFDNDRSFVLNQIGNLADPIGFRVELWGETMSTRRLCFMEQDLERFEKAPGKIPKLPETVFIFWDPGGGGGSLSAGVSFCMDDDGDLMVGYLFLFFLLLCLLPGMNGPFFFFFSPFFFFFFIVIIIIIIVTTTVDIQRHVFPSAYRHCYWLQVQGEVDTRLFIASPRHTSVSMLLILVEFGHDQEVHLVQLITHKVAALLQCRIE